MPQALPSSTTFLGHTAAVYALAHGEKNGTFLSGGGDGLIVAWDIERPDEGTVLAKVGEPVFSLWLNTDRRKLMIGTGSGRLLVLDLASKVEEQVLDLHRKGIFRILPTSRQGFVCAGGDGILSSWQWTDALRGNAKVRVDLVRQIPLCEEKLRGLSLSSVGDRLAVACGDGSVRELEAVSFNERFRFTGHENGSTSVVYHPTKPILFSGGKDGQLRLWHTDGTEGQLLAWAAHKGAVYATALDPSGSWLATVGRDSLVKIWDTATLEPLQRSSRDRTGHTHSVNAAIWCGNTLITASDDRSIRSWTPTP